MISEQYDVLVVGGGAAGALLVAAQPHWASGRRCLFLLPEATLRHRQVGQQLRSLP